MRRPGFRGGHGRGSDDRGRRGGSRSGPRAGGVRGSRRGRLGGRGGGGSRGGGREKIVAVEAHRHPGVFVGRTKDSDMLLTRNMVVGESVYGEKRISVDGENQEKIEYRVWNPFRSKLAAAIVSGVDNIHIPPGAKVLCLGVTNGITVSHISDIVGPEGRVYAVAFSHRSGRDLSNVANKRMNIILIIEDAYRPHKYRTLIDAVDTIFADIAQPDQADIVALNAHHFLKNGGHFVISIKASCIDSTAAPEPVFTDEVKKLQSEKLVPKEKITLEPYERDHVVVFGDYKPTVMEE